MPMMTTRMIPMESGGPMRRIPAPMMTVSHSMSLRWCATNSVISEGSDPSDWVRRAALTKEARTDRARSESPMTQPANATVAPRRSTIHDLATNRWKMMSQAARAPASVMESSIPPVIAERRKRKLIRDTSIARMVAPPIQTEMRRRLVATP